MVFGWLNRRIARSAAKTIQKDPRLRKELVASFLAGGNNANSGDSNSSVPLPADTVDDSSDDFGSSGDLLLDSYYDMLNKAKGAGDDKALVAYAAKIDERERWLERSERGRNARAARTRRSNDPEAAAGAPALPDLNIMNLAPHADAIGKEVVDWLSNAGVLPQGLAETATGQIANAIKQHPDLIPRGYTMFQEIVKRYSKGGKSNGTMPGSPGQPAAFDAAHPETWAPSMGYGK